MSTRLICETIQPTDPPSAWTEDAEKTRGSGIQPRESSGLLPCQHAKELLEAVTASVRELVLLHAEQFDAVITGDLDSTRLELSIHAANERKRETKYAYLRHLKIHNCSKTLRKT